MSNSAQSTPATRAAENAARRKIREECALTIENELYHEKIEDPNTNDLVDNPRFDVKAVAESVARAYGLEIVNEIVSKAVNHGEKLGLHEKGEFSEDSLVWAKARLSLEKDAALIDYLSDGFVAAVRELSKKARKAAAT
jgi:hypothetical protein